jgi:hypothetical protein
MRFASTLAALAIFLVSTVAHADVTVTNPPQEKRPGLSLREAGTTTTGLGLASILIGGGSFFVGDGARRDREMLTGAAVAAVAAGTLLLSIGLPMLAVSESREGAVDGSRRHRRDHALFVAGIATCIAGGVAMNGGASWAAIGANKPDAELENIGMISLLGGAILTLVGAPMAFYGGAITF